MDTLSSLGLEFAVVGGVAVAFCSTPRFTADIDAVILDIDDRLEWLIESLGKAGYSPRTSEPVAFARRTRVLTLIDADGTGIDLMMGLLPFDENLVRTAIAGRGANGLIVPSASPENLIVMKAIAWRPKDIEDIRQIVSVNPEIDRSTVLSIFTDYAELLEVEDRVSELATIMAPK